jgi:hypothetical protein
MLWLVQEPNGKLTRPQQVGSDYHGIIDHAVLQPKSSPLLWIVLGSDAGTVARASGRPWLGARGMVSDRHKDASSAAFIQPAFADGAAPARDGKHCVFAGWPVDCYGQRRSDRETLDGSDGPGNAQI